MKTKLLVLLLTCSLSHLPTFGQILFPVDQTTGYYTNRLLYSYAGGTVTNRITYTNALGRGAFGDTNGLHIRYNTNAGALRWEWKSASTVLATNTANRFYGTWKTNGTGAATYGYTLREPTALRPVMVDALGTVTAPTEFAARNSFGSAVFVSARGIANGLSDTLNDGYAFGPDTPGTTTSGIQEAILALPYGETNRPGGGTIYLGPGVFYTTTTITNIGWPNPFCLTIAGPGMTAGGIAYVGGVTQSVIAVGAPFTRNRTSFHLRDCFVAHSINACTNIVELRGNADTTGGGAPDFTNFGGIDSGSFTRVFFGMWTTMANNGDWGFTQASANSTNMQNTVGLFADCNFNQYLLIKDCHFQNLLGIALKSDHSTVENCMFGGNGWTAAVQTNNWPVTSPLHCGAAITLWGYNGNEVIDFRNNCFIGSYLCYYAGNNPQRTLPRTSYGDQIEGGRDFVATKGNAWTAINPQWSDTDAFTNNWYVTSTANFSTWRAQRDTNNLVRLIDPFRGRLFLPYLTGPAANLYVTNGAGAKFYFRMDASSNLVLRANP